MPVCRHFKSKGFCLYGDNCQFDHTEDLETKKTTKVNRGKHGKKYKRNRIANEGRCGSLRKWCIDTFGLERLRKGGVLDVGGGKGELSFEFLSLNEVPATVVDPRQMDLNRFQRKLQFGFYHRNTSQFLESYNTNSAPVHEEDFHRRPKHIRGFFRMSKPPLISQSGLDYKTCQPCKIGVDETIILAMPDLLRGDAENYARALDEALSIKWTNKGIEHEHEEGERDIEEIEGSKEDGEGEGEKKGESTVERPPHTRGLVVTDFEEASKLVRDSVLVVSMHGDQATEPAIDFALETGKPFAVVPCCVYSREFPKRVGPKGGHVRAYGEFIDYLLAKDTGIKAVELDFEGKNILLYHLGRGGVIPLVDPQKKRHTIVKGPCDEKVWWAMSTKPTVEGRTGRKKVHKDAEYHLAVQKVTEEGVINLSRHVADAMSWFDEDEGEGGLGLGLGLGLE